MRTDYFHCRQAPCNVDRETRMVTVERDASGKPKVWCDPCIAPLVKALNHAGIKTIASCCGHGHRPATVGLASGEWLVIVSEEERKRIDALFPADINGERRAPHPYQEGESE